MEDRQPSFLVLAGLGLVLAISIVGAVRLFGIGLPQQATANAAPSTGGDAIIDTIRNSGAQFQMAYFEKWRGDAKAYGTLEGFLAEGGDTGQNSRKALDALASVAGSNPKLAVDAFQSMEKFALDDCVYASKRCDSTVSATVASAKSEVPAAMAILGYVARSSNNNTVLHQVTKFLDRAKNAAYWENALWKSDGYLGDNTDVGLKERNLWLAKLSQEASDRLTATANSASLSHPTPGK